LKKKINNKYSPLLYFQQLKYRVTKIGCIALTKNPTIGISAFSALLTQHGNPISNARKRSKNEECGAATKIVASSLLAFFPFTFI
jgi:hypothetical protein